MDESREAAEGVSTSTAEVLQLVKGMERRYVDLVILVEALEVQDMYLEGAVLLLERRSEVEVLPQEEVVIRRQKVFEM